MPKKKENGLTIHEPAGDVMVFSPEDLADVQPGDCDDIDREEAILSYSRVYHDEYTDKGSGERFDAGHFLIKSPAGEIHKETLSGTVIWVGWTQTFFPKRDDTDYKQEGRGPLCRSHGAVVGSRDQDNQGNFGNCHDCTLSKFDEENDIPPRCKIGREVLLKVNGINDPILLRITSTGIFSIRALAQDLKDKSPGKIRSPYFYAQVNITTETKEKDGFKPWYVPKFTITNMNTKEDQAVYRELRNSMSDRVSATIEATDEELKAF